MRQVHQMLYGGFALLWIGSGTVLLLALQSGTPSAEEVHLARELGAGLVFVGLMHAWCLLHYERRIAVHLALLARRNWAPTLRGHGFEAIRGAQRRAVAGLGGTTSPTSRPPSRCRKTACYSHASLTPDSHLSIAAALPGFVTRELRAFLDGGILANGLCLRALRGVRQRRPSGVLVQGPRLCPRCVPRRMADLWPPG
jgi:hypothetical protein